MSNMHAPKTLHDNRGGPEGPYIHECPLCGEEYGQFPSHLEKCEESP